MAITTSLLPGRVLLPWAALLLVLLPACKRSPNEQSGLDELFGETSFDSGGGDSLESAWPEPDTATPADDTIPTERIPTHHFLHLPILLIDTFGESIPDDEKISAELGLALTDNY